MEIYNHKDEVAFRADLFAGAIRNSHQQNQSVYNTAGDAQFSRTRYYGVTVWLLSSDKTRRVAGRPLYLNCDSLAEEEQTYAAVIAAVEAALEDNVDNGPVGD